MRTARSRFTCDCGKQLGHPPHASLDDRFAAEAATHPPEAEESDPARIQLINEGKRVLCLQLAPPRRMQQIIAVVFVQPRICEAHVHRVPLRAGSSQQL